MLVLYPCGDFTKAGHRHFNKTPRSKTGQNVFASKDHTGVKTTLGLELGGKTTLGLELGGKECKLPLETKIMWNETNLSDKGICVCSKLSNFNTCFFSNSNYIKLNFYFQHLARLRIVKGRQPHYHSSTMIFLTIFTLYLCAHQKVWKRIVCAGATLQFLQISFQLLPTLLLLSTFNKSKKSRIYCFCFHRTESVLRYWWQNLKYMGGLV